MAEKIHSLTVVLDHDFKDDEVKPLINAIKQLKGVISVNSHIHNCNSYMAKERAKSHYARKLWEVLYPPKQTD